MYDSSNASDSLEPDYTDLMIVSNVLLRVMDGESRNIPKLDKIPAARKVINKRFKAETSVINEYRAAFKEFHIL